MNPKDISRTKLKEVSFIESKEVKTLQNLIENLRMEVDILKETIEVLKKTLTFV